MKKYHAEINRSFAGPNGTLITAKTKIARAIDSEWKYSWHWKDDTWVDDAIRDCIHRLNLLQSDLAELRTALDILSSIED